MTGHTGTGPAAPNGAAGPRSCSCWSCDGQCGGSTDPGSCGPLGDLDGRPVCEFCRQAADVLDRDRTGAKVTIAQDAVRLCPDVFGAHRHGGSMWLDARSARHLGLVLIARAAELDLAEAAAVADDPPGRWGGAPVGAL